MLWVWPATGKFESRRRSQFNREGSFKSGGDFIRAKPTSFLAPPWKKILSRSSVFDQSIQRKRAERKSRRRSIHDNHRVIPHRAVYLPFQFLVSENRHDGSVC